MTVADPGPPLLSGVGSLAEDWTRTPSFVTGGQFQLVVGLLTGSDGTVYVATLGESGATETARLYGLRPDGRPVP